VHASLHRPVGERPLQRGEIGPHFPVAGGFPRPWARLRAVAGVGPPDADVADRRQKMMRAVIKKFIRQACSSPLCHSAPRLSPSFHCHWSRNKKPWDGGQPCWCRHDHIILSKDRLDGAVGRHLNGKPFRSQVQLHVDDMNVPEVLRKARLIIETTSVRKNFQTSAPTHLGCWSSRRSTPWS